MGFGKKILLFAIGGSAYVGIELLWRGRSHSSMFLAGGSCFLLLGELDRRKPPVLPRAALGSGIITMVEYAAGLVFNRNYHVWDYRDQPLNLHGQICLPFSLIWVPIGLAGMFLYRVLDSALEKLPAHKK